MTPEESVANLIKLVQFAQSKGVYSLEDAHVAFLSIQHLITPIEVPVEASLDIKTNNNNNGN